MYIRVQLSRFNFLVPSTAACDVMISGW